MTADKIAQRQSARLATAPESARGLMAKCHAGTASPRAAIKSFCLECCGFDRAAIAECGCVACSLWRYRPFQSKAEDPESEQ
jgi:hypothetical protein